MLGLPRVPPRQAPARDRARPRRHDHPHAHGQRLPHARAAREVLRPGHGPARGGRPRHRRAPRHVRPRLHGEVLRGRRLLRARQLHRELQPRPVAVPHRRAQGLAGAELLLQHELRRRPDPPRRRAVVAAGRLRPAAGDERSRLLLVRLPGRHRPRQRLGVHRCPRPRLRTGEPVLHGHRPPRDRRRRAGAHEGDRLPPTHVGAHEELRRVPRLLAAALLRQRGRAGRVPRLPRARRRHGPHAAAQVGDPRPGRRAAHADDADPRRPPPRRRPGELHRAVQRDRRDDRRRHGLPARGGQLPLRRRRPVRRRLAEGAGPAAGAQGVRQADDGPAAQHRRPGPAVAGHPARDRLDPAHADRAGGPALVPLPRRAASATTTASPSSCRAPATRASWATRSSATRPMPPRCGTRSSRRARRTASRRSGSRRSTSCASSAGSSSPATSSTTRSTRSRRASDSPSPWTRRTRTSSAGPRSRSARRIRSACSSGWSSRATRSPGTGTTSTSGASASASSRAAAGAPTCASRSPSAACRCSTPSSGTELEIGKLDGLQKRIPATVVRFPFYDPDKTRPRA